MRLLFHHDALAALRDLQNDPARATLFQQVVRAIRDIRADPGSRTARRQAWVTDEWGQVWAVPVRSAEHDWLIIWTPEDPEAVVILYLGAAV
jgi:hypothetical protein